MVIGRVMFVYVAFYIGLYWIGFDLLCNLRATAMMAKCGFGRPQGVEKCISD